MPPSLDPKRLVLGFIALALLVGASSFGGRTLFNRTKFSPKAQTGTPLAAEPTSSNVFLTPKTRGPVAIANEASAAPVDTRFNFTDQLLSGFANGLEAANPEGPKTVSGLRSFDSPGFEDFLSDYSINSIAQGSLTALAKEASPPALAPGELKTIPDSADAAARYISGFRRVWEESVDTREFVSVLGSGYSDDSVNAAQVSLDQAIAAADRLEVPEKYASFHSAFLQYLHHSRNMLSAGQTSPDDPVRVIALNDLQTTALNDLSDVVARRARDAGLYNDLAAGEKPGYLALLFGVPTANAMPVIDFARLSQNIIQFVKKTIIATIKDRLIHQLVQQVISWVQGGGKPAFVTNFGSMLKNAATDAVGAALDDISPELCQSFGPLVRVNFLPVTGRNVTPVKCTLDRVVSNIRSFYQNFQSGGWVAYGTMLNPQNNYFGSLIAMDDEVARTQAEAQAAAALKSKAGKGFTGQEQCVKMGASGTCLDAKTTTPGANMADVLSQTMLAPMHEIVNAQDIANLAAALINAALSKIVQAGTSGLLGIGSSGSTTTMPNPCAQLKGQDFVNCQQTACQKMPAEYQAECQAAIVPPTDDCPTGFSMLGFADATSSSQTSNSNILCSSEIVNVTAPIDVTLDCSGSATGGKVFISTNTESCRSWSFDPFFGGVEDSRGNSVNFISSAVCPLSAEDQYKQVTLQPGMYNIGRWRMADSGGGGGVLACTLSLGGN